MLTDTWLTPPEIVTALGKFDLDPATPPVMPWKTAEKHYTEEDDGLTQPWHGRVWLNPPYSREAVKWLRRLSDHGDGIALIFARTETSWFFDTVWRSPTASSILFLEGRLYFHRADGERAKANSGAPSVLVSYDNDPAKPNACALKKSGIAGQYMELKV